jgi:hypothetical protein
MQLKVLLEISFSLPTMEESACLHGLIQNSEDADSMFVWNVSKLTKLHSITAQKIVLSFSFAFLIVQASLSYSNTDYYCLSD